MLGRVVCVDPCCCSLGVGATIIYVCNVINSPVGMQAAELPTVAGMAISIIVPTPGQSLLRSKCMHVYVWYHATGSLACCARKF